MFSILCILLLIAAITDVGSHKIPNVISLGGIALGLVLQVWLAGWTGLFSGISGLIIGFAIFIPAYALHVMGAGDVKLMAMVGVFVGPKLALVCVASTLIIGMLLGFAYSAFWGKATNMLKRYYLIFKTFIFTFKWIYIPPGRNDAGAMRFPYGLAILAGTIMTLWYFELAFFNFI